MAKAIANSPLVKTAIFGGDANWGRIIQAAGKAGVGFDPERVSLKLQGAQLMRRGRPTEADLNGIRKKMKSKEIALELRIGGGRGAARVWTCDLTHGYIDINTDYN